MALSADFIKTTSIKVEQWLESYLGHFLAVQADFLTNSGKPIKNKIAKEKISKYPFLAEF